MDAAMYDVGRTRGIGVDIACTHGTDIGMGCSRGMWIACTALVWNAMALILLWKYQWHDVDCLNGTGISMECAHGMALILVRDAATAWRGSHA
eukprot:1162069-Pelagomonas_calceolata.AAC.8